MITEEKPVLVNVLGDLETDTGYFVKYKTEGLYGDDLTLLGKFMGIDSGELNFEIKFFCENAPSKDCTKKANWKPYIFEETWVDPQPIFRVDKFNIDYKIFTIPADMFFVEDDDDNDAADNDAAAAAAGGDGKRKSRKSRRSRKSRKSRKPRKSRRTRKYKRK